MALHRTSRPAPGPADDIYTLPISERALPKHRMPQGVSDARAVRAPSSTTS